MRRRREQHRWGLIAVVAIGGGTAWADPAFDRRHAELLRRGDLQFAFDQPQPPQPPPGWMRALSEFLSSIAPIFGWLLWIGLGALALALAYFAGRELWSMRVGKLQKAAVGPPVQAPAMLAPERARALLSEADRLAATGDYQLAARTLLHRTIEEIEDRRPNVVRRSWTAREIEASGLPAKPTAAFAKIAAAVEQSWFGGRMLGQREWLACRAAYEPFTAAEAWSS